MSFAFFLFSASKMFVLVSIAGLFFFLWFFTKGKLTFKNNCKLLCNSWNNCLYHFRQKWRVKELLLTYFPLVLHGFRLLNNIVFIYHGEARRDRIRDVRRQWQNRWVGIEVKQRLMLTKTKKKPHQQTMWLFPGINLLYVWANGWMCKLKWPVPSW